ncbi:MAG: cell division protein FtsL [Eubacteriales bacterium]|nr:cell division protein FtsL [Eubacteriales bacterium]
MKLKRSGILVRVVILALVVYACIGIVSVRTQVEEARLAQEDLQAAVNAAAAKNAELEYQITHAEDDETIEDIARSKLGLVYPGEKIFYDVGG